MNVNRKEIKDTSVEDIKQEVLEASFILTERRDSIDDLPLDIFIKARDNQISILTEHAEADLEDALNYFEKDNFERALYLVKVALRRLYDVQKMFLI